MSAKKNITLQNIADELNISIASVSLALSNQSGISEELRTQILAKAQEMGYCKNKRSRQPSLPPTLPTTSYPDASADTTANDNSASINGNDNPASSGNSANGLDHEINSFFLKQLTPQQIVRVDVIIDDTFTHELSSFYMEIFRQLSQLGLSHNISIFIQVLSHQDRVQNELIFNNIYHLQPQGVIVIGQITSKALSLLKSNVRCPVVFIDYYLENEKHFNFVLIDSFASMYFLVKHLIQDYHYHDLCFVGSIHKTASILDRYLGYVKALRENGLDHCIYNVLPDRDQGNNDQIQIELPAQEQFTLPELFVCNCDRTAQILIKELHKRGIRVPEQVSVCGFDNYMEQDDSEFNGLGKIKIHTCQQPHS